MSGRSAFSVLVCAYRLRSRDVLVGWLVGMGWQSAQVAAPLAIAAAVDRGLVAGDAGALVRWVALLAVLCVVEVALTALRHRFAIIPAVQVSVGLREETLARVHRAVPNRNRASGDIVSRATFDVDSIGDSSTSPRRRSRVRCPRSPSGAFWERSIPHSLRRSSCRFSPSPSCTGGDLRRRTGASADFSGFPRIPESGAAPDVPAGARTAGSLP